MEKIEVMGMLYRAKKAYRSFMNGAGEREMMTVINEIENLYKENKDLKNKINIIGKGGCFE